MGRRAARQLGVIPTPKQIKALRAAAALSQAAAGELVYVNYRTVQQWESGRSKMPAGLWELAGQKWAPAAS
jgi:DNA-binding transcriptional regulator YiaG